MSYSKEDILRILENDLIHEREDKTEFKESLTFKSEIVMKNKYLKSDIDFYNHIDDDPNLYILDVNKYLNNNKLIDIEDYINHNIKPLKIEVNKIYTVHCQCGGVYKIESIEDIENIKHYQTSKHKKYFSNKNITNYSIYKYFKKLFNHT